MTRNVIKKENEELGRSAIRWWHYSWDYILLLESEFRLINYILYIIYILINYILINIYCKL